MSQKIKLQFIFFNLLVLLLSMPAFAEDSNRSKSYFGAEITTLGVPDPALFGVLLELPLGSAFRVGAGVGRTLLGNILTIGGDFKWFIIPSWNFTPIIGIGASFARGGKEGAPGIPKHAVGMVGFDWMITPSLDINFGAIASVPTSIRTNYIKVPVFINFGYYTDFKMGR
jgi:hypothetical protein